MTSVVTGKSEEVTTKILKHEGMEQYFDYIIGATKDNSRTLKTEILNYAMNEFFDINDDESIIIGDMPSDIKAGKIFNIDSIGVTYGTGHKEKLQQAGATYIVEDEKK